MDGRFDRSGRTGSQERVTYHAGLGLGRKEFSPEGYGHVRKHMKHNAVDFDSTPYSGSTTEGDFCDALHGGQHKKVRDTLMKRHIEENKPKFVEYRRSSPSVIARLMGLDEFPPPEVLSESRKENADCLPKSTYVGRHEKCRSYGHHEYCLRKSGMQTLRDAQELVSSLSAKQHNGQVVPEKLCSKPELDFIRKQFMEANRLSTSETIRESKEFNEALDVLDANKDPFLKFLQEPNSLFEEHVHDLKFSKRCGQMSNTRISKPSDGKLHGSNEPFYRLVEETKQFKRKQKDTGDCCLKSSGNLANHSASMHKESLLHKLLRSRYAGTSEASSHLTSIVLLKPSFQKVQSTIGIDPPSRSLQNCHHNCRRRRGFHKHPPDGREQFKSFDLKTRGYKAMGSRDVAGDVLHPIKPTSGSCSHGLQTLKIDCCDSSLSHLSEPSLFREARKHLSEHWKMTRPLNEKLVEGSSTLAEMLSLSNIEAPRTLDQFIGVSDEEDAKDDMNGSLAYPICVSSRDGWKDDCDAFLPISNHLPASTAIYGTSKPQNEQQVGCMESLDDCYMLKDVLNLEQNDFLDLNIKRCHSLLRNFKNCHNKGRPFRSSGEENKSPDCEVELHQDVQRRKIVLNDLIENKIVFSRLSQRNKDDLEHLVPGSLTPKGLGSNIYSLAKLVEFQQPVKFNDFSSSAIENEVAEGDSFDSTILESPLDNLKQYGASIIPKDAAHPSPVSVLEPPSEDEKSGPEFFERINAGLQDLQMQFDLLKLESDDSGGVQSKAHILNDEARNELLQSLKDGDVRNFLYLLDVLTVSGIYAADNCKFFDACYTPECPVFSYVFDKLEKKYKVDVWLRSERKLLFDQINSILAEVLAPCIDLQPWVKSTRIASCRCERLVQECWRVVVMQQKKSSQGKPEDKVLDTRWLYLGDDINMVGREIERMMTEDLLDELVSEFIFGAS